MMLISRSDSNTAKNIRRNGFAALNFIPNKRKYLANVVRLGYPGQSPEEKKKESIFTLIPPKRENMDNNQNYPEIIKEAFEIMEYTWIYDKKIFNYIGSEGESHFLLNIDNILMESRWNKALNKGNGKFPQMPVDFGYRDSSYFWFAKHGRPYKEAIPQDKGIDINSIKYQIQRLPYDLQWDEKAYEKLVKVPRIFLKRVLEEISQRAIDEGRKKITSELLEEYRKKKR